MDSRSNRLIKAAGLAPLAASLVLLVYVLVFSAMQSRYDSLLSGWLFLSFFAVPIAYVATLLIGLPAHLILCKLDRAKVANYVIVGVVVALMPFLGIYFVDGVFSAKGLLGYPTMVLGCAAAVSWAFATIALKSSDSHDADKPRPK